MNKAFSFAAALVLTLSVLTGCGCRNSRPAATTAPTTMPTVATVPTTQETTVPTTSATEPTTQATIQDGNGPLPDEQTSETGEADSRMYPGSGTGITGSITG